MIKFFKKTYFVFLPLLVTVIAYLIGVIRFGAVDDILMYKMANSFTFNTHSEQLMFINVGIGFILKLLYGILPAVNWFSLLYLALFDTAFAVIFYTLKRNDGSPVFTFIIAGIEYFLLMRISFTVISFVLAASAILLFIDRVDELKKENIPYIIFSSVLLIFAFAMRNGNTLYCILLIFSSFFIFAVIKQRNSASAIALIILICIVANAGVTAVNRQYTKSVPQDTYFAEFQKYRSAASDNGKLDYKENIDYFKENGITKNDIRVYKQFVYGDKSVFTSEKLKSLNKSRSFKDKYNINPVKIAKNVYRLESPLLNYIFWFSLFSVILFLIYKKKRFEIAASFLVLALAEFYLFFRRRGVVRVTDPLAAVGLIVMIFVICFGSKETDIKLFKIDLKKYSKAIICCALCITVLLSGLVTVLNNRRYNDYSDTVKYVQTDSEHIYFAAPLSAGKLYDQRLTILSKEYNDVRVYALEGDWWIYSYYWYSMMDKLSLSKYNDCSINALLDDKVRFISRNKDLPDYLVKYYKEHYNVNVKYEKLSEFDGGMKIYKFTKTVDGD